jgi:hypothetical protein
MEREVALHRAIQLLMLETSLFLSRMQRFELEVLLGENLHLDTFL